MSLLNAKPTPDEVRQTAIEHFPLLWKFMRDFPHAVKLAGGKYALMSELSLAYMRAINHWLEKQPEEKVSTYIYNNLKWELSRIYRRRNIISIPDSKTYSVAHARQAKRIFHFHGEEGKCGDSALLAYDNLDRNLQSLEAAQYVPQLWGNLNDRTKIAIKLKYGLKLQDTDGLQSPQLLNKGRQVEDKEGLTLQEVAKVLTITQERVRQIIFYGMRKMERKAGLLTTPSRGQT